MSRLDIEQKDVFISWTGKDEKLKDEIKASLEKDDLEVLESKSECTGQFAQWSSEAAKSATVFLLILTENTKESKYVPEEILSAIQMEDAANRIVVVCSDMELYRNLPFEELDPNVLQALHISAIDIGAPCILTEEKLKEICHKTELLIVNRADSLYRANSKPDFMKVVSLSVRRGSELQGAFDKYYLSRTITDVEYGKQYDGKELFAEKGGVFFLHGPAGSGKSLYVRRLHGAMDDDTIVISLSCAASANSGQTLFNDMLDEFKRVLGDRIFYTESNFERLLYAKHLLLILDGLDEIATESGIRNFIGKVERYYSPHRDRATILFTGRDAKDADMIALGGRQTRKLRLDDLTDNEIETLGNNLFLMFGAKDKGKEFYVRVKDLNCEIKTNPLLLSQLAIIYKDSGKIPETIVGIFDAIAEITFRMDVSKDIKVPTAYEDMVRDIGHILKMFSRERYGRLSKGNIVPPIKIFTHILKPAYNDYKARAEFLIEYLQSRAILTDGEFYHKLFLEYFTAVSYYEECFDDYDELEQDNPLLKELFSHYSDGYWARVIQMFLIKADSLIDEDETERLYDEALNEIGDADRTLLFDVCRDLIVHRDAAQTTILSDMLLRSVRKERPPYGPLCWYVPEYSMYAALIQAAWRICKDDRTSALERAQAVALARDVCYIYSRTNTCAEVTDKVDGRALFNEVSANLTGVRRALCELFYLGETDITDGADVYPRCFNPSETVALRDRGCGIGGRMSQPFNDELGLYEHESYNEYLGECWGFVSCPYDDKFEDVLRPKKTRRITGLAFSPAGRTEFADGLKFYCKSVKIIYYPEDMWKRSDTTSIWTWEQPIWSKMGLDSMVLNIGILYFGKKVVLPDGWTEFKVGQFTSCSHLTEITLSEGTKHVRKYMFFRCQNLRKVHLPASVRTMGEKAFDGCSQLTYIKIPEGVESIDREAFKDCVSIEEIAFPKSLEFIYEGAFQGCRNLKKIRFSDGLQSLGYCVFSGCESLQNISLPNGVERLEARAFEGCENLKEIDIPGGVSEIDFGVFEKCSNLEKIKLPDSIKKIKGDAFKGCSSLEVINIPCNVTEIGGGAFESCASMKEISLSASVTKIGEEAFSGCEQLRKVHMSAGVLEIGDDAFAECPNLEIVELPVKFKNELNRLGIAEDVAIEWLAVPVTIHEIPQGATVIDKEMLSYSDITKIDIPYGVRVIKKDSFKNCKLLEKVTLPETLTEIEEGAFYGCASLQDIKLPASLLYISVIDERKLIYYWRELRDFGSFEGCSSLEKISIPDSVQEIGEGAFKDCSNLQAVRLPNNMMRIGWRTFEGCSSLEKISIPDSVQEIGERSFKGCSNLQNIKLSQNLMRIGREAFCGCSSLNEISIPDSVQEIGDSAFNGCSNLQTVRLPHNLMEICQYAFAWCSSLNEISIPDSVQEIGDSAFYDCSSLKEISIPESVQKIGDSVFSGCSSLQDIQLPHNLMWIGWNAFNGCSSLKEISIPESIEEIEYGAFEGCSSLERIFIPNSVQNIGIEAFCGCSSLKEISIPDSVREIGRGAFNGCSNLKEISIPDSVKYYIGNDTFRGCVDLRSVQLSHNLIWIGSGAFADCSSLKEISIPESIEKIDDGAFEGCSGLKEIVIPQSAYEIGDGVFAGCAGLERVVISGNLRNDIKRIFGDIDESIVEYI